MFELFSGPVFSSVLGAFLGGALIDQAGVNAMLIFGRRQHSSHCFPTGIFYFFDSFLTGATLTVSSFLSITCTSICG